MEKLKSMVDISSFMLFEATGDSETYIDDDESILGTSCMNAVADEEEEEEEDDDDDAQSCSYDDSILDSGSILKRNGVQRDHPRHTHLKQHQHQHHDDDDDDDEEGEVIDQKLHDRVDDDDDEVVVLRKKHKKLRVCGDSNMDMINEVEKNKLFWDACLAS